jgi:phosphoglycolate phosphatase-like HAD superfamily hydrolase
VALLSRDSRRRVERILSRHALDFDRIASRDDPPMKPHLKGIRQSVRWLGVEIDHALTNGDYIFDIRATQAVRMRGVRLPEPDEPLPLFL